MCSVPLPRGSTGTRPRTAMPIASFQEPEGLTLVVTAEERRRLWVGLCRAPFAVLACRPIPV